MYRREAADHAAMGDKHARVALQELVVSASEGRLTVGQERARALDDR